MPEEEVQVQESTEVEAAEATTEAVVEATPTWRDHIPEEFKEDPTLSEIKAESMEQAIGELAKMNANAQRMIGMDKVVVPGKDATDADWEQFHIQLGRPENADGYEPPQDNLEGEFDKDRFDALRADALRLGLNRQQYAGMARAANALEVAKQAEAAKQTEQLTAQWHEEIRAELGDSFDQTENLVATMVDEVGGDEFRELLEATGLNNHPTMYRFLARVSKEFAEDEIKGWGGGMQLRNTPEQAKKLITAFEGEHGKALRDKNHPDHKALSEQRSDLFRQAYPS
jgi:hypothetical protein